MFSTHTSASHIRKKKKKKSLKKFTLRNVFQGFPGDSVVKNPLTNAQIRSRIWEDPTCHRASKTVHCNY